MQRVAAVDIFRGLVLLLLLPDPTGAFSLHKVESLNRGDSAWAPLVAQFQHQPWAGLSVWDLVMPAFVFLIGISIPLSYASRLQRGESPAWITTHAVLRAVTLILLGLLLTLRIEGPLDELWPLLVLAAGIPIADWIAGRWLPQQESSRRRLEFAWWSAILAATAYRYFSRASNVGIYESAGLLVQVGLAFLPAYALVNRRPATQCLVAVGILAVDALAFMLYPAATDAPFAHWAKNANVASAFDTWFFQLFARTAPFVLHDHGYQTLSFVPMTANMIFGVAIGAVIRRGGDRQVVRRALLLLAAVTIGGGLLLGVTLSPIVKSIWTPSYALVSTGCVALLMALLHEVADVHGRRAWAVPLIVLGSNSILLYVLAMHERWRVVGLWERAAGLAGMATPLPPVVQSLVFLATLWMIAWLLYRRRWFVRV